MKNEFWDEQMLKGLPEEWATQRRLRDTYEQLQLKISDQQQELHVSKTLYYEYLRELHRLESDLEATESQQSTLTKRAQDLDGQLADTELEWNQQQQKMKDENLLFRWEYERRKNYYMHFLQGEYEQSEEITALFKDRSFKGIIVYPAAVQWQPIQRPQQFLLEFARKGYLCFFCLSNPGEFRLEEVEENLFLVNREEYLLSALKTVHVLVLNTWMMQNAWIDCLPQKSIWYDILDRVDFFSLYDKGALVKHLETLHKATIVTYSARNLQEFTTARPDAVYLPNAARWEDFAKASQKPTQPPKDMRPIVRTKRKILGYFGAIEEWFDPDFLHNLLRDPNVEIVCIGHVNIDTQEFGDRVHFLGPKPYGDLPKYAAWFDALLIPFVVNELTNSVSPVKFFEYCAIGKPIISAAIREVEPFAGPGVHVVKDSAASLKVREVFKTSSDRVRARLTKIAQENSWRHRIEIAEQALLAKLEASPIFANQTYLHSIGVFTATFFDYNGQNFYSGGAERYLLDLHEVCQEMGYRLEIYQYGNFPWYRRYRNIDVYSLGNRDLHMNQPFTMQLLEDFNTAYLEAAKGKLYLNLYSAYFQAFPRVVHPSIGISHGVAWDNNYSQYENGEQFWAANKRFIEGARNVEHLVSVDTNTPNWLQTVDYAVAERAKTIPNYVDTTEFHPVARQSERVRIVYPRRLYAARGLYLTLDVAEDILREYEQADFHFVGKGFEEDVQHVDELCKRWPGRVFRYHKDPDHMHEVYKEADIVLIPTLYSEGTSLSCLEACATGNAVIATRVGGLCDIIINDFNGYLISPNREELLRAIRTLLDQPELRQRFSKNAMAVADAFNKQQWKQRWKDTIAKSLPSTDITPRPLVARKSVEVRIQSVQDLQTNATKVNSLLRDGYDVFIRCEQAAPVENSFSRLQWLHPDEQLAFEPDEVLEWRDVVTV